MTQKQKNHCVKCNAELKKSVKRAHSKYRCFECNRYVNNATKKCNKHPSSGYSEEVQPEGEMVFKECEKCGHKNTNFKILESSKPVDRLQNTLKYNRQFMNSLKNLDEPLNLINTILQHIERYQSKNIIRAFRNIWIPENELEEISEETECDKWVEKSHISNIIMWYLSLVFQDKTEALTIQEIAHASTSLLGRSLSQSDPVDHNTLGVRLEKPELIEALEMMLQLSSAQLSRNMFEENGSFMNVYYDWFYIVKSGDQWDVCQTVGREKLSKAIKIGIGIEWETKAVVSLVMHGEHHDNDALSFRKDLMVTNRSGIVHITDMGPFSTETMVKIKNALQYFVIKLKSKIKYKKVHTIFKGDHRFQLETSTQTNIRLLESSIIRLDVNQDLGDLKYIRFQYNSLKTGKYETVELISSLPLSAGEIIRIHAWRWVATETEFRTLQHQFGMEKFFVKKPEKIWPLLLLILSGKMLMELTFKSIHQIHGGLQTVVYMKTADFRRSFDKFITAVLMGNEDPINQINPCGEINCCFRRKRGRRLQ